MSRTRRKQPGGAQSYVKYFRAPATTAKRKADEAAWRELEEEGIPMARRTRRRLPNTWDDIYRAALRETPKNMDNKKPQQPLGCGA